jgi:hypothetical protein
VGRQDSAAAEIDYLSARCRLVLDALEAAEPEFRGTAAEIRAILADTAAKGNVRGIRTMRRDLLDMSRALPDAARRELQARLDAQAADDPFRRPAS